jgi:hypothetical protein
LAIQQVDSLGGLTVEALNWADAEVFPASRLSDPEREPIYRQRLQSYPKASTHVIEPGLFRAWGPALVVLVHPLKPFRTVKPGEWVRSDGDPNLYVGHLPPLGASRGTVSLEFLLPGTRRSVEVLIDGQPSGTVPFRAPDYKIHQITPRFRFTPEVLLRLTGAPKADRIPFVLRRWRRPQQPQNR